MNLKTVEIARKWGKKREPLKRMYRKICDRELFLAGYGKLYANKGAMTPGTDSQDTVDGMSLTRIDKTINRLKLGTYQWQPVRREYRPKKNGKYRPLGITGWTDKLVQEVIRIILEAYYEPQFSEYSHGFRPGRGCHTALEEIHSKWKGVKWFIEGDIEGCYDNIDQKLLLNLIQRDIPDQRFLKLIKEMLEAGYMEEWQYHTSYSGVAQGNVISPILSNILLNELDKFVKYKLMPKYTRGKRRKRNPTYTTILEERSKAKAKKDVTRYQELTQLMRKTPSVKTDDEGFRRLYYCRYCDDFLMGYAGPKAEAEAIKQEIKEFLQQLKLTLSEEKTLITHAASQRATFLGYELSAERNDTKLSQDKNGRRKRRSINSSIHLHVPRQVAKEWENRYKKKGKPIHRAELLNHSDYEIVMLYNMEFQGLANYYTLAQDVAKRLYPVRYAYMQSLVKTLARKHKKQATWIYRQYKHKFETGMTGIKVTIPREEPKQPLTARFGVKPIRRQKTAILIDEKPNTHCSGNELVQRLLANECELCGSQENIEVHHIRKVADIKKKYEGRKEPPKWASFMMERNRKTIVVCRRCHQDITYGRYDGPKLA